MAPYQTSICRISKKKAFTFLSSNWCYVWKEYVFQDMCIKSSPNKSTPYPPQTPHMKLQPPWHSRPGQRQHQSLYQSLSDPYVSWTPFHVLPDSVDTLPYRDSASPKGQGPPDWSIPIPFLFEKKLAKSKPNKKIWELFGAQTCNETYSSKNKHLHPKHVMFTVSLS